MDSDGYIGVGKKKAGKWAANYQPRVQVKQVDTEATDLFRETFGGHLYRHEPSTERGRPLWCWQVHSAACRPVLEALLPYLRIKTNRAENALALCEVNRRLGRKRFPVPDVVPGEPMLGHPTASQQSVILIHGTPENLDLAEYVYHFLINQGEIEWRQYRAASLRKGERRDHFLYGLYTGFAARIGAERRELERQHALVLKRDAVLEDFFDLLHPSVRRSKGRGLGLDQSTFAAGQAAGRQMQIRPGLDPRGSGGIKGYLG